MCCKDQTSNVNNFLIHFNRSLVEKDQTKVFCCYNKRQFKKTLSCCILEIQFDVIRRDNDQIFADGSIIRLNN